MRTLTSLVSLPFAATVVLLGVAPAAAQSGPPGQCDCAPAGAPIAYAAAPPRWATQRLGVGLRVGSLALGEEPDQMEFATGGLALRWRWSRRLELEGSLDHGGPADPDELDPKVTSVTAALLVRFRPEQALGWYLLGGIGATSRDWGEGTTVDTRAHVALGAGVEYRFEHLVLGFEARVLGLGQGDVEDDDIGAGANAVAAPVPTITSADELGGGQVNLSASWYF